MSFISPSVVAGFIQAAAFTIPLGQLKKLFGVKARIDNLGLYIVDKLSMITVSTKGTF